MIGEFHFTEISSKLCQSYLVLGFFLWIDSMGVADFFFWRGCKQNWFHFSYKPWSICCGHWPSHHMGFNMAVYTISSVYGNGIFCLHFIFPSCRFDFFGICWVDPPQFSCLTSLPHPSSRWSGPLSPHFFFLHAGHLLHTSSWYPSFSQL